MISAKNKTASVRALPKNNITVHAEKNPRACKMLVTRRMETAHGHLLE